MTTIAAPSVAGRERAREDVAGIDLGPGGTLIVEFPERALATPSYLDELILVVCGDRRANLVLRALSPRAQAIAAESAARHSVGDRLSVEA